MYLKAQGPCLAVMVVTFNGLVNTLSLGNSFWISKWTSDPRLSPTSNSSSTVKQETSDMYLEGLAGFGISNSKYCNMHLHCRCTFIGKYLKMTPLYESAFTAMDLLSYYSLPAV